MRVVANRAAETITVNVPSRFSSLIVELPVQQIGSGDPSPENIRPITQWTDVALYVADTDTATEPTVTTTFPTPIFGGMVDVARGEVASLYNEKKSSSGWEMVEAGQFRCQVGAFNNGDETSTNVADLYSSHYKTVSNKDAYDATDDLTCGTPTIEGVTYLYVNDLDYSTLEDFTAYIGDVQFVYKSHVPMSDVIEPTVVYLPEGTSYVWAEGAYVEYTVTGTPPLSLTNSMGKPLESWSVELSPKQDLHGYDSPWPAGGGVNKFDETAGSIEQGAIASSDGSITTGYNRVYTTAYIPINPSTTYYVNASGVTRYYPHVYDSDKNYIIASLGWRPKNTYFTSTTQSAYLRIVFAADNDSAIVPADVSNIMVSLTQQTAYSPYANICPILGTDKLNMFVEESYDPSATPKAVINLQSTVYLGTISNTGGLSLGRLVTFDGSENWIWYAQSNSVLLDGALSNRYGLGTTNRVYGWSNCIARDSDGQLNHYAAQVGSIGGTTLQIPQIGTNFGITDLSVDGWKAYLSDHPLQICYQIDPAVQFPINAPDISTPHGDATTWATAEDGTVDSMTVTYIGKA